MCKSDKVFSAFQLQVSAEVLKVKTLFKTSENLSVVVANSR